MPVPLVLLVTHRRDSFTVDRVAEALAARGAEPLRVDADQFPARLVATSSVATSGVARELIVAGRRVDGAAVRAVWIRKLWPPELDDALAEEHRAACAAESTAAWLGFLDGLAAARFVNPLAADHAAENKLRQLQVAARCGLPIPDTLVTNDPERVRAFFARLEGRVVAKMLTPYSVSMEGDTPFVYTSRLREDDLAELHGLRHAPMVFQEEIGKAEELRVVFVAGRLFAGAVDAPAAGGADVDWRRADAATGTWRTGSVSDATARAIRALMSRLGLTYGALDLIRAEDEREVFLEVNPRGEWGMLERDLGHPIGAAIAAALLEE